MDALGATLRTGRQPLRRRVRVLLPGARKLRTALLAPGYREACYWLEDTTLPGPFEPEPLPSDADVVVVGGGYTGMAAALELARRGARAIVIERHRLGWGASTRNGGMVLPDVKHEPGGPLHAVQAEAVRELEGFLEAEGIDGGYSRTGHLHLAHCASHAAELRALQRAYRNGIDPGARLLTRDELGAEIGSRSYSAGLLVTSSGGLHPARYFAGLAKAALAAGAEVRERTEALAIERGAGGAVVATSRGAITARDVLVATDGYTGPLVPWLRRRVVPVGSYIIATERIEPDLARAISPTGRMMFDTKNFLFYWRLSPDGSRVLFGGRASFAPTTLARARDHLYRGMVRVHPQLEGVGVEYAWGGQVGLTMDRSPRLGRRGGITYALGYSGTGVAASLWFGRRAAAWLYGDEPPAFADAGFQSVPLSRLRALTLPLAGLWFRARDLCWRRS